MIDIQTKLGEHNTEFDYLRDVRSFDDYQNNVLKFGFAESVSVKLFIDTCLLNDVSASVLTDCSCESSSPANFHYDVRKISCSPDYRVGLFNRSRFLEVKHTDKNVSRIMIKKYDVDKYLLKKSTIILHVINYGKDNVSFTILTPLEVSSWLSESNDKFGGKGLYVDLVSNHKYFYFNKLNADFKSFLWSKVFGVNII